MGATATPAHRRLAALLALAAAVGVLLPGGAAAQGGSPPSFGNKTTIGPVPTQEQVVISGAYRVVVADLDGDAFDDLLFHGPNDLPDTIWFQGERGLGPQGREELRIRLSASYSLVAGEMTGDAYDDVFLYGLGTLPDSLCEGHAEVRTEGLRCRPVPVNGAYRPLALDADGDGLTDILWYGPGSTPDYVWYANPGGAFTSLRVSVGGSYQPVVGRFDAGPRQDVFWYSPSGPSYLWLARAERAGFASSTRPAPGGSGTRAVGADVDGNGRTDLGFFAAGRTTGSAWLTTAAGFAAREVVLPEAPGSVASFLGGVFFFPRSGGDTFFGTGVATGSVGPFLSAYPALEAGQVPLTAYARYSVDGDEVLRATTLWYGPGDLDDDLWYEEVRLTP